MLELIIVKRVNKQINILTVIRLISLRILEQYYELVS
jgi:hypothetical protein